VFYPVFKLLNIEFEVFWLWHSFMQYTGIWRLPYWAVYEYRICSTNIWQG